MLTGVLVAPVLAVSLWLLVKRVKKRRAIEREIWGAPPISSAPWSWRF